MRAHSTGSWNGGTKPEDGSEFRVFRPDTNFRLSSQPGRDPRIPAYIFEVMTLAARAREHRSRRRRTILALATITALVVGAVVIVWAVAAGGDRAQTLDADAVDWPATGTAALAYGDQVAVSPGGDTARPIASLTKVITALVVLDSAPLADGAQGPAFPMTEHDVTLAAKAAAAGGISTPVSLGQVLSQRQLLEYMLVASSNNLAASLANRVFGSEFGYLAAARAWLDAHDLADVRIADASGMSPNNVASARDLLTIARLAAEDPVIAAIAPQPVVLGPLGEPLQNTNDLLTLPGITGLKTGHTDEAGYTALFSVDISDDDEPLIGVILASPTQAQRATDVTRLIARARALDLG